MYMDQSQEAYEVVEYRRAIHVLKRALLQTVDVGEYRIRRSEVPKRNWRGRSCDGRFRASRPVHYTALALRANGSRTIRGDICVTRSR